MNYYPILATLLLDYRTFLSSYLGGSTLLTELKIEIPAATSNWINKWTSLILALQADNEQYEKYLSGIEDGTDYEIVILNLGDKLSEIEKAFVELNALQTTQLHELDLIFRAIRGLEELRRKIQNGDYKNLLDKH